jgi:hypothetical protein
MKCSTTKKMAMSSDRCDYCEEHKLKVDPEQNYGEFRCNSCGKKYEFNDSLLAVSNSESRDILLPVYQPPPLNRQLIPLSDKVLEQCKVLNISLGGVDHSRREETAQFWMENYGHPPGFV